MIITNGQLRPPSPKELKDQRLTLERIALSWTISTDDSCPTPDAYPCGCPETEGYVYSNGTATLTTQELLEFHKDYGIPYAAYVVVDEFDDFILDWTHLRHCDGCGNWMQGTWEDHAEDELHKLIVRSRADHARHNAAARNAEEGWETDDDDD